MEEKQMLEEVLKFIKPQMKVVIFFISEKAEKELKYIEKNIEEGLKSGLVKFSDDGKYDIDLNKVEEEKGKEWTKLLRRQLIILKGMLEKFKT